MSRWFHVGAGGLAGLAVLLMAVVSGTAGSANGADMFESGTDHYKVKTDVSADFARLASQHMEALHAEYARRFEGYGTVRERYEVVVFRNEAGYRKAVPAVVWGSTGVFSSSEDLLAAHMDERTVEEVLRTLYHEGFHQFMYCAVSRKCPVWFNEGMAEYFSEATWNGRTFTTGLVPTMRLHTVQDAISRGTYVPFGEMFTVTTDRWIQNVRTDAHRADLYYCQAWSIVQFLAHADDGRYAGMLNSFLKAISRGKDSEDAMTETFGSDLRAFEQAWARYMMSLTPSTKFRCRDNMEAIMLLAGMMYKDPRSFESPGRLRRELLFGQRFRWEIKRPNGQTLRSDDVDQVNAIFRCPFGNTDRDVAYVLVHNRETGMPTLVYDGLPGIVITAYYRRQPTGDLRVVVEELVRDTVSEGDRRAVQAARSAQFD